MIIEERKSHAQNLESIDNDLRLENVRQNAEKLGWDYFNRSIRRNLVEKRQTLEPNIRLDVISSLAFMKEHLPFETVASIARKIQQLADGLGENCTVSSHNGGFYIKNPDVTIDIGVSEEAVVSCKIGYFGQPLFEAPEALAMMKSGQFSQLRDAVSGILHTIPRDLTLTDKNACRDALRAMEHVFIRDASDSSFSAINSSKYGFYSPRTELRPGRLYYIVEPVVIRMAAEDGISHADNSYLDMLPYLEISFAKCDKKCILPVFAQSGEWSQFNELNACVRIRFKHSFLFSQHTTRKIAKIVAKAPLVRSYVNFYQYATGRSSKNLELLTQFPDVTDIQQHYDVDSSKLSNEDDSLVVEMFLDDLRKLPDIIQVFRSERKHSSLWESILAMCESRPESSKKEVQAVNIQLSPRRIEFLLKFDTDFGGMTMQISEKSPGEYFIRTTSLLTGTTPSSDLDNLLTEKLNSTWSIPVTLSFAMSTLSCRLNNLVSPLNCVKSSNASDSDKRHQWCLVSKHSHKNKCADDNAKKDVELVTGEAVEPKQLGYTREDDEELQGSLLASFGEVDPYYEKTSTIGKTRPPPRPKPEPNQLTSMDMMTAELEMERSRQSMDSAMLARPHDLQRLSFLESARVQMRQSIGAAHAVGLASHQPFPSPGGPMRHHSYMGGSYDSPAPYDPNIPASIAFPDAAAFGKKQRKPRAKKQPGEDVGAPAGRGKGRKGRGAAAVGAGSGRKSSGVAGENQYGMDQMRPPLQRSFSDYPNQMNPQYMNQYQQMQQMQHVQHVQQMQQMQQMQQYQQNQQYPQNQQYRMQMQQQQQLHQQLQQQQQVQSPKSQRLTDEDSDDDVDPPPLPKPQVSAASRSTHPPHHQLGNPMVGYPGMPLQSPNHLPLTPSPLSAPPKPFSPEQQNYGMKLRDSAYWKDSDRLDVKPDVEKLKQQMAASSSSSGTSGTEHFTAPSTSGPSEPSNSDADSVSAAPLLNKPPASAQPPKKKLGLEATISKIRGQQEQALQKQEQERIQQRESVDSASSEQPTPQPQFDQQSVPQLHLEQHQLNRARNMNSVFDDETGSGSSTVESKPSLLPFQKSSGSTTTDNTVQGTSSSFAPLSNNIPNLKKEAGEEPEREKEKLIVKIPKSLKVEDRREDRRERDRNRDRDGDRDRSDKDDKKDKEKKDRDKERRRQRERERSDQKKTDKEKDFVGKEKESKKRKLEKNEEKDRREPERKKGKSDGKELSKTSTTAQIPIIPTRTLKNFKIPKKDTVDDDKKDVKEETNNPGPSTSSETSIRKEAQSAPISRKESTSVPSTSVPLQRKESFTSQSGSFPQSDHHREPSKKKPPPISGSVHGSYPGPPSAGPIQNSSRSGSSSGSRKQTMPPPSPMRGPPSDQMYRERTGSMRGFPPSSHYHGSGGSGVNKQVASYAQGLPPGMGPPAVKPHGNNYQASQWVRPPTHRDSHSYHGMPSLGPAQVVQREPPPPTPQMTPIPKEAPAPTAPAPRAHRENRARGSDDGPDSPEEGTLRIDDE